MGIFREYDQHDAERSDRSAKDRQRHRDKIKKALKENIGGIVSEESIIGKSGDKTIKVPIKGVKEYRFVFGDNSPDVVEGDGNQGVGDVIGKRRQKGKNGPGPGGNDEGEDIYETEVSLEEIIDIMMEDLGLPDLERKSLRTIETDKSARRKGYRRAGIRVRLDKYKSAKERIKRLKASERVIEDESITATLDDEEERFPFRKEDLRYKHLEIKPKEESNAVVFCIMDVSGSMYEEKKYIARSLFFLLHKFIERRYNNVEVVFIAHHSTAKEVSEDDFFHKGESGGTIISSGLEKALEIIDARYHPSLWNVYAVYCSDGDNFDYDNPKAIAAAKKLIEASNLFGYVEIADKESLSDKIRQAFGWTQANPNWPAYETFGKKLNDAITEEKLRAKFQGAKITDKSGVWPVLKALLAKEK